MDRYTALLKKVIAEFPGFRIVERDRSWLGSVFWLLQRITGTSYDNFLTTIGRTLYVGPGWENRTDNGKYASLRHELVHLRQFARWPFGSGLRWVNTILFSICYLLVLPVLWTMRAKFEREGYTQTLLVKFELNGTITDQEMEYNAERMVRIFAGPSYMWMATKKATYAWAMETQRKINRGEITNEVDQITDLEASRVTG